MRRTITLLAAAATLTVPFLATGTAQAEGGRVHIDDSRVHFDDPGRVHFDDPGRVHFDDPGRVHFDDPGRVHFGLPLAASSESCSQSYLPLPDPSCTPGAANPAVTQDTIDSTICVPGYTKTIRPPSSYTSALKVQQIAAYGYADTSTADYEEDHLIALEDGGDPRSPQNLWPEPRYAADNSGLTSADKDQVENNIHTAICNGTVTLDAARNALATDWTTAEQVLGIGW